GAQDVLKTHCHRCHGDKSSNKGGMSFVLDRDKLVARHKIVPGDPGDSPLFRRVAQGEMPPEGVQPRPGKDDLALLRRWIEAGAPPVLASGDNRAFIAEAEAVRLIA